MADVLVLSLGTTLGWRVADSLLIDQLRAAGADATAVSVRMGASGRMRRAYPVTDLVEALAARRALAAALRAHRPRALVICSTTAAMLADPGELPFAVRLDAPALLNRPGARNAALHALERRALRRARLVLPWSAAARHALPAGSAPALVLPPPVERSGEPPWRRDDLAVAYTPDVKAKGLDIVCAAWAAAEIRPRAARGVRRGARGGAGPSRAHRHPPARERRVSRQAPGGRVSRRAAARAGVRGRRALGGLRPGAARGAGGRRPVRHRALRGAVRGAAHGARAGPGARGPRARARRPGAGAAGGVRARRERGALLPRSARPRCSLPTARRRWSGWWPTSCCPRCSAAALQRRADRALPGLGVGLQRVARAHRAAARGQPRAQLVVAHQPAQRRRDRGAVERVHEQGVLALHGDVARGSGAAAAEQRRAPPPRPRAARRRRARRCSPAPARRPPRTARAARPARRSRPAAPARPTRPPPGAARPRAGRSPPAPAPPRRPRSRPPRTRRSARAGSCPARAGPRTGSAPAARRGRRAGSAAKGSRSALCSATSTRAGSTPRRASRSRPWLLATRKPSSRGASARWMRRCSGDSSGSLQGVSSLNTTSGRRRRRHQASARQVVGPNSELTTQLGSARRSAAPRPRASTSGERPGRRRCQARSVSCG